MEPKNERMVIVVEATRVGDTFEAVSVDRYGDNLWKVLKLQLIDEIQSQIKGSREDLV